MELKDVHFIAKKIIIHTWSLQKAYEIFIMENYA